MSTDNDAAIAQALAREEQERADAALARQMEGSTSSQPPVVVPGRRIGPVNNCPGQHGLNEFRVSYAQRVHCNICKKTLRRDEKAYGCVLCNFDICEACCQQRGGRPPQPSAVVPNSNRSPFSSVMPPQSHMCIAPCVIGNNGLCVEMMVDTGAQSSVISLPLARQLGIESRIDRTHQGVAQGVGRAKIVGRIRNVLCELGHVEFPMDFMVLDVQDKILLLGLDLMRRYKCIVDLERDVLIFGGKGGVEVAMLPADDQHIALRNQFGCPLM